VNVGETSEEVKAFAQERELTFTNLLDETASAAQAYQVRGIPTSFLIDRDGVIQIRHTGALDKTLIDEYIEHSQR
jgi:peroxiredoxin